MKRGAFALALLAALVACACDRLYADPVVVGSASRGVDASIVTPRTPPVPCPRAEAAENAPCPGLGAVCEFGGDPDPACNATWVCAADDESGWYWTEKTRSATCALECPSETAIVDGAPCDLAAFGDGGTDEGAELHCTTTTATCVCTTGRGGLSAHPRRWVCTPPGEDCPIERPMLGQVCVGERDCDYGSCSSKRGARMICRDEVWQIEAKPCE